VALCIPEADPHSNGNAPCRRQKECGILFADSLSFVMGTRDKKSIKLYDKRDKECDFLSTDALSVVLGQVH
jgi:hypothetical protein